MMNDPKSGPSRARKTRVRRRGGDDAAVRGSKAPSAAWRKGRDWQNAIVPPNAPLLEALRVLDGSRLQIVLVADETGKLAGIATDGDLRRAILDGGDLARPISEAMTTDFFTVAEGSHRLQLFETMIRQEIRRAPMLDDDGRIIDLVCIEDLVNPEPIPNIAVLMVGGLGTRLRPLTASTPKPMVPVGHQPVLETILTQLKLHGLHSTILAPLCGHPPGRDLRKFRQGIRR
jgi:CBS-domain-containing membrane protein